MNSVHVPNREILREYNICVKIAAAANCHINFRPGQRLVANVPSSDGSPLYTTIQMMHACLVDGSFPNHIVLSSSQKEDSCKAIHDLFLILKNLSGVKDLDSLSGDEYRAKAAYDEVMMKIDLFGDAVLGSDFENKNAA